MSLDAAVFCQIVACSGRSFILDLIGLVKSDAGRRTFSERVVSGFHLTAVSTNVRHGRSSSFTLGIKLLAPVVLAKKVQPISISQRSGLKAPYREEPINRPVALSTKLNPLPLCSAPSKNALNSGSRWRFCAGCCSQTLGSYASEYSSAKSSGLIGWTMMRCPSSFGCKMAGSDMGLSELPVNQRLVG